MTSIDFKNSLKSKADNDSGFDNDFDNDFESKLKKYAKLLVRSGCNIGANELLLINAFIDAAPLVRLVIEEAYIAGAKHVHVKWADEKVTRLTYDFCPIEEFETVPEWSALQNNQLAEQGAAFLSILSEDPELLSGVEPAKLQAGIVASHTACKPFYDSLDFGNNVWCIAAYASRSWAVKVFPNLSISAAEIALWGAIFSTVRVDTNDPEDAWNKHRQSFDEKKAQLNAFHFTNLHYCNSLGTDLNVALPDKHIWNGGGDITRNGVEFFPNMPTEEVFTSPHANKTEGIVYSSMPLSFQGAMVENFWLRFENGKAVECGAEKGLEVLQSIIGTDEGSAKLGEVALVPYDSPIRKVGILFLNTLFDENASCHLALGKGFPDCYEGGQEMSSDDLKASGINDSAMHVDFMIGTSDLIITGTCADGTEVLVFKDGNWAI